MNTGQVGITLRLHADADMSKNPSTKKVTNIQKTTKKYEIIGATMIWIYALIAKMVGF